MQFKENNKFVTLIRINNLKIFNFGLNFRLNEQSTLD